MVLILIMATENRRHSLILGDTVLSSVNRLMWFTSLWQEVLLLLATVLFVVDLK